MNENIRRLFPALEKYVYLNSAALAPLPVPAVEAVLEQLKDVSANGSTHFPAWLDTKNRARDLLAKMLKVRAEQIALMRNTSDSLASIANGLSWSKGDNIVSFEREFPANFYAWRRVRDAFGVELRLCPERGGRIDLAEFINLIDSRTKLVSISAVQFASGFRADLERIGRAARKVDALFVVDFIQCLGALPLDLPAQMIDAGAGASHKWLCAPEGSGILYLSDRARERIQPTAVGWISVEEPWNFDNQEQDYKPTALAWESGTAGSALYYGLEASLKMLESVGGETIAAHLFDLTDYLCELLAAKNYEIVSSRREEEKSQIVSVKYRGDLTGEQIAADLERENIIVSPRGDRLRIAPHFFNTAADIEKLVAALP